MTQISVTLDIAQFRSIINFAGQAAAKDIAIPALEGMHFTVGGTGTYDHPKHFNFRTFEPENLDETQFNISVACTDRYRLAWASLVVADTPTLEEPVTFLLPAVDMIAAAKGWPKPARYVPAGTVDMVITVEDNVVTLVEFSTPTATTKIHPLLAEFPKYRQHSDLKFDTLTGAVGYNPAYLAEMAKACAAIAGRHAPMRILPNNNHPMGVSALDDEFIKASGILMPVRMAS